MNTLGTINTFFVLIIFYYNYRTCCIFDFEYALIKSSNVAPLVIVEQILSITKPPRIQMQQRITLLARSKSPGGDQATSKDFHSLLQQWRSITKVKVTVFRLYYPGTCSWILDRKRFVNSRRLPSNFYKYLYCFVEFL